MERDLAAVAEQEGRPKAALIRQALGEYLARQHRGNRRLGFAAIGASGHRDTAERHEELLWQEEASPARSGIAPTGYLPRKR